ncbi:Ral GTPase-activating protein subunit alpha-2 [Boothiomyces macroporosus]|uniref:Ral GTPase-activating protein subunit alpha-2 n=1 Tax=Boothiomyces macroporosus TaxID=261099 RepID=A0AAD5UKL6_9FUNG|nr:Ral GTPase-activating protein subunit alpha-2 [Boothiomyces macroporosus]KAJ3260685.1 Ral GTPase-activating protein subunit alpha-2 [Boothiomyces macroporosus]
MAALILPALLEEVPDVVLRSVFAILGSLLTYEKHYQKSLPNLPEDDRESIVYSPNAQFLLTWETNMLIIDRLVWGISEHLQYDDRRRKISDVITCVSIVSNLLKTLLELLMTFPSNLVSNPNISLRISEVIEETIHHATIGMDPNSSENSDLTEAELNEVIKGYQVLKESAINVLIHLTHHLDNFSPMHGAAVINSDLVETDADENVDGNNIQYLSIKSGTIVTLIDMPATNKVRLILRNAAGKFAWDMKSFHHSIDEVEGEHKCAIHPTLVPKKSTSESSKIDTSSSRSSFDSGSDMLETLLMRISKNNPECLYPDPPSPEVEFHKMIMKHVEQECLSLEQEARLSQIRRSVGQKENLGLKTETSAVFENARLLLAHFGQLNFDHLKNGEVHLLTKSVNLTRDLRGLDRKFSREVAKFAIIYVGPDQEDEMSIFKNEAGSIEYDEFVKSLGWEINLAEHTGYTGGLDSNLVKGGICTYYCTSTVEMVFHDVTKMRIDKEDLKQVKKKRHIGNDHVHIVWNENRRDYKYDTIGGDFGNAQIIVTPLPNGLYAIDTYRDDQVQSFGPLQSRNMITKECLGPLVRKTAIQAYRAALSVDVTPGMETHPFTLRKQTISLIASRHKANPNTYEKFLTSILGNEHIIVEEPPAV